MSEPKSVGHLTEKWWQTKKLTEWVYQSPLAVPGPLLEKLGPASASVNIEERDDRHQFVARSRWFGAGRKGELWADTLGGLRTLVERAFNDQMLAHSEVRWSDWVEIEIEGNPEIEEGDERARARQERRARIAISWKILKRARFPDGRDMVLDGTSLYPFPKAKAAGEGRESDGLYRNFHRYHQDDDHQFAYLPATAENLRAVHLLIEKIEEVNTRLQALLGQKQLTQTIRLLNSDTGLLLERR